MKLLRVYWDQGALLEGEWNVPLYGKYEDKPVEDIIDDPDKEGIVLMDWVTWSKYAPWLDSNKASGILLPMDQDKAFSKAASIGVGEKELCVQAQTALADPRVKNVAYTYFDWL